MPEFIFEINEGFCNEETGEVCMKPEFKGELVRCKDCRHYNPYYKNCMLIATMWSMDGMGYCFCAKRRDDAK